eukprot:414921_1
MGTIFYLLILLLSSVSHIRTSKASDAFTPPLVISSKKSKHNYLYTTMSWGIPERQSFKVFIDTTNQLSWVYNESVNTRQSTFDTSKPSSFDSLNTTTSFAYQSQITQIQKGKNWLIVEDRNNVWDLSVWTPFSLANQNGLLTEREGVSGFLCFNRQNNVMQRVGDISIDMPNNNIYFGEYIPSYIHNQSVAIELSNTINDKLKKMYVYSLDYSIMILVFQLNIKSFIKSFNQCEFFIQL